MKLSLNNMFLKIGAVVSLLLITTACSKLFELTPEDTLTKAQVYQNIYDADAAIVGVYGKFMGLAKQHVILNELRADLIDVTDNADEQLRQINNHNVTTNNVYADPRPYYELILNCNDVLKNFKIMLQTNKIKTEEYNQRSADVIALRTWVYLQVGINFGNVPYITESAETIADLSALAAAPRLSLDNLIKELIKGMEAIPTIYLEQYTSTTTLVANVVDANVLGRFFINKYVLLGDLYLWNNQFLKAAQTYRYVMEYGTRFDALNPGEGYYGIYKVTYNNANARDIGIGYADGRNDVSALIDQNSLGWRSIFTRGSTDSGFGYEWIWALPFDKTFQPGNPFVEVFSNVGGSYLLKPSQQSIDLWNSQKQTNNFPWDARGKISYKIVGGQPVVAKYLYNYFDPNTSLPLGLSLQERPGNWYLYRAANLQLRYAEAANRDGRRKLAFAMLSGIKATFDPATSTVRNTSGDTPPYDFEANNNVTPIGAWYRQVGVRGRALLQPVKVVGDSTLSIESSLIEEDALELAYEGQRWGDLVRVATRRNDPAFLADKVYLKLKKANNPNAEAVRSKLMDRNNWFLPFKIQ